MHIGHWMLLLCNYCTVGHRTIVTRIPSTVCNNIRTLYVIQAVQRGWQYPQYVFLLYGWYQDQWWYPLNGDILCNSSQMEQVIERSLTITQFPEILNQSKTTDTGTVNPIARFYKLLQN